MKKLLAFLLGIMVMATMIAGCGGGDKKDDKKPAAQKFINIATGGTSGTYFPLGGALADILNKNIPGTNASAQSTGASVANVNLLSQGKVEIAFIQNDIAYYAANGTEMFKGKQVAGLQGLATLYPETVQIVTLKKSGIKSVADFKGKVLQAPVPKLTLARLWKHMALNMMILRFNTCPSVKLQVL